MQQLDNRKLAELKYVPTISDMIYHLLFPCKVNLPKVKKNLKFSIINFVYKLPHQLLNGIKLKISGNLEGKRKSQNSVETQANVHYPNFASVFCLQQNIFSLIVDDQHKVQFLEVRDSLILTYSSLLRKIFSSFFFLGNENGRKYR